jgi:hypothetical protein
MAVGLWLLAVDGVGGGGGSDYCVDKALAYVPSHLTLTATLTATAIAAVNKIGLLLSEGLCVRIVAYRRAILHRDTIMKGPALRQGLRN